MGGDFYFIISYTVNGNTNCDQQGGFYEYEKAARAAMDRASFAYSHADRVIARVYYSKPILLGTVADWNQGGLQ